MYHTKLLKLKVGYVKVNSDGCSKGNPGHSGSGSILRDANGSLIWAQVSYLGVHSNMVANARAMLQG